MTEHNTITGTELHEAFHYVSASDPGAVGANLYWLDTAADPYVLKRRNSGNSAWVTIGASGGGDTPPAVVVPTDITGCVRWYDASQELGAEDDAIATLTDYSAAGVDATQSTLANKALLRLNVANGHPAWQFDGSNDYYDMGANLDLPSTHTVLAVASSVGYTQTYSVIMKYKQRAIYAPIGTTFSWGTYSGGPLVLGHLGPRPQLMGFWGSSDSDWYAVNGKQLWKAPAVSFGAEGTTRIGLDTGGTQAFAGFLMELIAFDAKISRADLLALTKHLHYKWGISDYS